MPSVVPQLEKIGRSLRQWQAELKLTRGLAIFFGTLFLLGLIDLWLRLDRPDRIIMWILPLTIVLGCAFFVWRALSRKFSPDGIAAMVEKSFPELDNHLINFLQLARDPEKNPLKEAYLREGAPKWTGLDFRKMRDRQAYRRSRIALGITTVALLMPFFFFGNAWGTAVWRTVNPFTHVEAVSLTNIVEVRPGDATIPQGEQLILDATVQGFEGHEVRVEVEPADASRTVYSLGRISGAEEQTFSHRIPKVATDVRYRFRAGDATPTDWFIVTPRQPSAFIELKLSATPPEYTGQPARLLDAREESASIPAGSEVIVSATANTEIEYMFLNVPGLPPERMTRGQNKNEWSVTITFSEGASIRVAAKDVHGEEFSEEIPVNLLADRVPEIEILSPQGRTILPPGEQPQIEFRVSDDHGLANVVVEQIPVNEVNGIKGVALNQWDAQGSPSIRQLWRSDTSQIRGGEIAFRIVARDNQPGSPNEAVSTPIIFSVPSPEELAKQRREMEEQAGNSLQRVVELQQLNIKETESRRGIQAANGQPDWSEPTTRQTEIRSITRELLTSSATPLGGLTASIQQLYVNEMVFAVDSLKAIPAADAARREPLARDALSQQNRILRQLRRVEIALETNPVERQLSGLSKMMESLVREQGSILTQTRTVVEANATPGRPLVDAQDELSEDMNVFLEACSFEAQQGASNAGFSQTISNLVKKAADLQITNQMILAAERLDEDKPGEAIPLEERSLAGLETLQGMLNQVQLQTEADKKEAMLQALGVAQEKLDKMTKLHETMKETMEQVRGQKDGNTEEVDFLEDAYTELIKNTMEALLEVPNDLHIFADLNVANDLVEDVFSIFEEVEQKDQSESTPEDVVDAGFTKNDLEEEMLAQMKEASDRMDAIEMWLSEKAEEKEITTEAFDQEQMPESGIALAELASQVEDIIGDLVEEDEEMADAAEDGATNHAMADPEVGWDILEGNLSTFAAQGKSGNQMPDHKEQDGRSNIGRQGMSTGETAAGSGTISEGDENIQARRTEEPTGSGQIDMDGEATTAATGGGKLATGKADDVGMSGGVERMDSTEEGSWEGMAALMARQTDAIYAQSSLNNVRVDSLKDAAHHLRQSADAVASGNIEQVREFRNRAVTSLTQARALLNAGPSGAVEAGRSGGAIDNLVGSGSDVAPPRFRNQVADYFKALNEEL